MKVTVVVDEAGKIIGAYVPVASERGPSSVREDAPMAGFMPSEGQEVLELELPDVDVPGEPSPGFLETLQRYKDRGAPEARE